MNRFLGKVMVALTLVAGSLTVATPAQAAGATIERDIFLASRAGEFGGTTRIKSTDRRIWLAADDYLWGHQWNNWGIGEDFYKERRIYLAAGYYKWNCVIFPDHVEFYGYRTRCTLIRESNGSTAFMPDMLVFPDGHSSHNGMFGSTYTWRSTLTRI